MVLIVTDMAAWLGCNEQAVYKQVYRQVLPHSKLGRKVLFLRSEVEAYLNGLPGMQIRRMNLSRGVSRLLDKTGGPWLDEGPSTTAPAKITFTPVRSEANFTIRFYKAALSQ